jgi:hypothetical protein
LNGEYAVSFFSKRARRSAILAFNSRRFYSDIHTFIEASKAAAPPPPESDAFPSAAFVLTRPILYTYSIYAAMGAKAFRIGSD